MEGRDSTGRRKTAGTGNVNHFPLSPLKFPKDGKEVRGQQIGMRTSRGCQYSRGSGKETNRGGASLRSSSTRQPHAVPAHGGELASEVDETVQSTEGPGRGFEPP